jgi:hypothetical protein
MRQLTALAARATQLVEIHGQATLAALHPLDHRLIARLLLEADGHHPGLEHVLQRTEVLGLGGDRQRFGDLLDESLPVSGRCMAQQLDCVGGAARSGRRRPARPRLCPAAAALVLLGTNLANPRSGVQLPPPLLVPLGRQRSWRPGSSRVADSSGSQPVLRPALVSWTRTLYRPT